MFFLSSIILIYIVLSFTPDVLSRGLWLLILHEFFVAYFVPISHNSLGWSYPILLLLWSKDYPLILVSHDIRSVIFSSNKPTSSRLDLSLNRSIILNFKFLSFSQFCTDFAICLRFWSYWNTTSFSHSMFFVISSRWHSKIDL